MTASAASHRKEASEPQMCIVLLWLVYFLFKPNCVDGDLVVLDLRFSFSVFPRILCYVLSFILIHRFVFILVYIRL